MFSVGNEWSDRQIRPLSDVVLDALSCGMDDVMQKPVDLKTLSKTIATALKIKRRESIPRLPLYQPK